MDFHFSSHTLNKKKRKRMRETTEIVQFINAVLMLSVLHADAFVLVVRLATEANVVEEGMMEEAGIGYVRLVKKKKKITFWAPLTFPGQDQPGNPILTLGNGVYGRCDFNITCSSDSTRQVYIREI